MTIKEKAIVTISRNKRTNDRSWCGELLEVLSVNSTHVQAQPVDEKSYWYGKPRLFLFDEYDFTLANNFKREETKKKKVHKLAVGYINVFKNPNNKTEISTTIMDSEQDAVVRANKCVWNKYLKIGFKVAVPYIDYE